VYCATTNVYDIVVDQGATLNRSIALKSSAKHVVTLAGYTARMDIREKIASSTTILELTTPNHGLTIDATAGAITILITPSQTAAFVPGVYVYDLELEETNTGVVTRVLQGNLTVRAEVTK
jgi:hypothetical protein